MTQYINIRDGHGLLIALTAPYSASNQKQPDGPRAFLTFEKIQDLVGGGARKVGDILSGVPVRTYVPGEGLEFSGGACTSKIVSTHLDEDGGLKFRTQSSVYRLTGVTGVPGHLMSIRYARRGYLDFNDMMQDGFYDGGRGMCYAVDDLGGLKVEGNEHREIILVDATNDQNLCRMWAQISGMMRAFDGQSVSVRASALSMAVSNAMGGLSRTSLPADFESLTDLADKNVGAVLLDWGGSKAVKIGDISHGVCRHRSILFKYCADRLEIPSRLVRGEIFGIPHLWNVVKDGEKMAVLDSAQEPGVLREQQNQFALYTRDQSGGGAGRHSIPVK